MSDAKRYTISICDDCLAGNGDSCNEPTCAFCRVSMVDSLREVMRCCKDLLTRAEPAPADEDRLFPPKSDLCDLCLAAGRVYCPPEHRQPAPAPCQHRELLRELAHNGMSRCGFHEMGRCDPCECSYRDGLCDAHRIESEVGCSPGEPSKESAVLPGEEGSGWSMYRADFKGTLVELPGMLADVGAQFLIVRGEESVEVFIRRAKGGDGR